MKSREPVPKLHDGKKSKILSQVEKEKLGFSDSLTAPYPRRVGEEARSQHGSKERFYASKSFGTGSRAFLLAPLLFCILQGCSPLRTSEHDERHQWELRLHEVQTNLDDFRHDMNCMQTELQILDGRIRYHETALSNFKQQEMEKQQHQLEQLLRQVASLEKRCDLAEKGEAKKGEALQSLSSHANETSAALLQFRSRMQEIEKALSLQRERLADLDKLEDSFSTITASLDEPYKLYRVAAGDTLEKIARMHKTEVDKIRKFNRLTTDLIMTGQELKIPL